MFAGWSRELNKGKTTMKKLVLAVIVGCIATIVQASSVNWSITQIKGMDGNLIGATTDKYTAVVTFYDAEGTAIAGATSTSTKSTAMSGMSGSWTGAAISTTYFADIVITDSAGNTLSSDKAQFVTSAAATYSINFSNGTGFSEKTAKVDYAGGWVAAPEPTSGLLLLLGVAGLALKRKRA